MTPLAWARGAGLLISFFFAQCSDPNRACVDVQGIAAVEIGAGNPNSPLAYVALRPGQTVTMSPGAQGGQHVWLQLEARGICPAHPRVRIRLVRTSDGVVIGSSQFTGTTWQPVAGDPGAYVSPPYRAVIEPDTYCTVVNGGEVRVEASVDDTEMHTAESTQVLIVDGWSPDTLPGDRMARELCCANFGNRVCWPNGPPSDAAIDASDASDADDPRDVTDTGADDASDASAPDVQDAHDVVDAID